MKYVVFVLCLLFASVVYGQCAGGTCAAPARPVLKSVLVRPVQTTKTVIVERVRQVRRPLLWRRLRLRIRG